jgi:sodium pump decarboxylase gamma subunit
MMSDMGFGLWMTGVGMGTVFLLLAVLWAVLKGIGALDRLPRRGPGTAVRAEGALVSAEAPADADSDADQVALTEQEQAAIVVAVLAHARMRRLQGSPEARSYSPGSHLFASRWVTAGRNYQPLPTRRER